MGSGMQWSFSNKVPALPHQFLSFKTTQEERSRNSSISDPLASSGYMTISTKDAFDSNQKPFLQKNLSIGKQAGNNHGMTVYPLQCSDVQSACLQEPRKFPVSNQSKQVSPVLQSNLATTGFNMVNSVIKPQPLGSKSSATPVSVLPPIGSIVGSTDLRNCSKSSGTPAQLTIFYGGSVCVFDDISPEKAKAVMLMAGNGSAANQTLAVSKAKLQTEISAPSKNGGFIISQPFPSSSPLPGPLPVTSHASSQPGRGSSGNNELPMIRPAGPSTAPNNHSRSAATKMIQPGGLPQARKASLARFLEKRKERVISTLPYFKCNKTSPECSTPGSDSVGFSMDFSGSCSLPTSN
ncbi:protein TIFY 6B-like isoform X2 [Lotus japonicus]|nr:protein TIFY 6B-like isoform X2 [Lotus japonicus]XP_057446900.1 protein TIFY 6B-like isoform X2 [Lotus japonicus]XP_057446901.1 protein TIFY 6B-like isoform X2 [Lotus japonicus]XP_057446902.1 protein TIFY 6B-like isoform X2 [Lotus japonicus]